MTEIFEKLSKAWAITLGDALLPAGGAYPVGAIAAVMPDEASARRWIDEMSEALASLGRGPAGVTPVGDPWTFMRRAATEGLAGIEGVLVDLFPERYMFMVRVEEAGATWPTVLASVGLDGWDACLTRAGVRTLGHAEVLHWQRFDMLDSVTGLWGTECPFRDWDHGAPLYELRSDDALLLLSDVPLIGAWNSTEGAFAFFTSRERAERYLEEQLNDGRNWLLGVGDRDVSEDLANKLRAAPVHDLQTRLHELYRLRPLAAWCVNPAGHRENAAYGRLFYGDAHPVSMSGNAADAPRMAAVSGIWRVLPDNVFTMEHPMAPWTRKDTIRWSGGQSLNLIKLDRSFVLDPGVKTLPSIHELTETEAEDLIASQQAGATVEEALGYLREAEDRREARLGQFHIVAWDAITGEGGDASKRFDGFLQSLQFLTLYEREHDSQFRTNGATSCRHIGFGGSGNTDFEKTRGERFRLGLRRLALRVLKRGYRPEDATDLVALCNQTLRTLHVEFAGFGKDLLWASPPEALDELLETIDVPPQSWAAWYATAEMTVDPRGRALVVARTGEEAFAKLLPKTRHFLATALVHMEEQGHAPQLDYAPISLEVVKALEVELVELLAGFRDARRGVTPTHDRQDHGEESLVNFMHGGKAPTLGPIKHLLKTPDSKASPLRRSLHLHLASLPNAAFITSSAFIRHALERVINKFRNGGAHESRITYETCRECIDTLVGTADIPGHITQVASWKP
jgi:hypothetical protein